MIEGTAIATPSLSIATGAEPDQTEVVRRGAWRAIPANLRFFFLLLALLLVLFALLRLGLILKTRNPEEAPWRQVAAAFIVGLRFDVSTACFLLIPISLLTYLPWTAPWRGRRRRQALLWGLTVIISVGAF